MIKNPYALIAILIIIEAAILYLASHERFKKYFQFLPHVFWMYFTPMLLATLSIIDNNSSIYPMIIRMLLPGSLFLLLIGIDLKAIFRLGPLALMMFFAGSLGMILGAVWAFFIAHNWIGSQFWSGFGALTGSWTGGSANMIAVKEALQTPDEVFSLMLIVDTIVPYVWMGILVSSVHLQPFFNQWSKADGKILEELKEKVENFKESAGRPFPKGSIKFFRVILLLTVVVNIFSYLLAQQLPEWKGIISASTWTIIIASTLGILCSLTPIKKLEQYGTSRWGYYLLYFVLTAIGAKASISNIGSALILILAGCVIVLIHAAILLLFAKWLKAPMFLVAVASQANIGGVASAPMVAEIYQPGLASVGLLLAILGNIIGTYLGIITGQLCLWLGN